MKIFKIFKFSSAFSKFPWVQVGKKLGKIFELSKTFVTRKIVKSILPRPYEVENTGLVGHSKIFKIFDFCNVFIKFSWVQVGKKFGKIFHILKTFLELKMVNSILARPDEVESNSLVGQSKVFRIFDFCAVFLKFSWVMVRKKFEKIFKILKTFLTLKMVNSTLAKPYEVINTGVGSGYKIFKIFKFWPIFLKFSWVRPGR